ncbi:uncharacterized protein LY79DRAFT_535677 [Colletotrichum navitas]|uniref:Uncharacterized protein n=1 Tax=Colletotrichum navitas TaxID=681940 RepID=A0AAD8QBQ9_9PEZI|nr:uncharacterized protein LY79DRAFT_535677 [Colletotrichum navitas]KAK1599641.1 hypothetical protein LY79DRAFT_535677 [Colletotrichum navitas]
MSPGGGEVIEEEEARASVVKEVINQPGRNEIFAGDRPNHIALASGALINGFNPGYGPMGYQLCTQCRRYWHTSFSETICYRCRNAVGYRGGYFDDRSSISYSSGYGYGYGYDRGYGHGHGHGHGYGHGHGCCRCSYCERVRYSGDCGCRGNISICRDRCGRPALCRPCPRRLAFEKKIVKRYYC